jgi:hypothetical protein
MIFVPTRAKISRFIHKTPKALILNKKLKINAANEIAQKISAIVKHRQITKLPHRIVPKELISPGNWL